jgi:hypothetical protein
MRNTPYGELTAEQREYVSCPDLINRHFACVSGWGQEVLAADYLSDDSTLLRATLAQCADDPAVVGTLARDPEPLVRAALAGRGLAGDILSQDADPRVREAALSAAAQRNGAPARAAAGREAARLGYVGSQTSARPQIARPSAARPAQPTTSEGRRAAR